jgi:hypothetical protein
MSAEGMLGEVDDDDDEEDDTGADEEYDYDDYDDNGEESLYCALCQVMPISAL